MSTVSPNSDFNPAKRSREDTAREIASVDAAIAALTSGAAPIDQFLYGTGWAPLGEVSLPIAIKALRHYRQRLCRAG